MFDEDIFTGNILRNKPTL